MATLPSDDVMALRLVDVIRRGDIDALRHVLAERPELASVRLRHNKGTTSTLLHAVDGWPGYFPNGPVVVGLLISCGADPDAPVTGGSHSGTPLHWAASSDDADVAAALIVGGADIEAPGASIAGGTPLDDAVGYGSWHVARLLVERGARVERLCHAAALGMMSRVEELLAGKPQPTIQDINNALWQSCAGGPLDADSGWHGGECSNLSCARRPCRVTA